MQVLGVHPGLTHRLLVAAARAHYEGAAPCDWTDLTERAEISASQRAINRALSHLAEGGLIEGVYTRSGWMHLHPTARGVRRAGSAARRPPKQPRIATCPPPNAAITQEHEPRDSSSAPALEQPVPAPAGGGSVPESGATGPGLMRRSSTLSHRILALRTQLLQALNVFKTQP